MITRMAGDIFTAGAEKGCACQGCFEEHIQRGERHTKCCLSPHCFIEVFHSEEECAEKWIVH